MQMGNLRCKMLREYTDSVYAYNTNTNEHLFILPVFGLPFGSSFKRQ